MPCDPLDITLSPPEGPSGVSIPGFGVPFSLNVPDGSGLLEGFPEDLLEIFDKLSLLIPPGIIQPALNPNFGKDVFDGVMKLMDQFMPFLMLYKFFMPILNIIICILEVLCASMNPWKMARAIRRLFRNCIPAFLNLFPIFALIIMIISLLLLLLTLVTYIVNEIIKFVELILLNIKALVKAVEDGDANSILSIAAKIGSLLCIFQNLFVLLSVFTAIFQIIKDMLALASSIPPCDNSSADDADGCCTPDVCPAITKSDYTRLTGSMQYLSAVAIDSGLSLPEWYGNFNLDVRSEGWFIYDVDQELLQEFRNIIDAADIPDSYGPKPNFFPTDGVYNETSDLKSVPYTVDMKMLYNPNNWGRGAEDGYVRYIEFKDCVVIAPPTYAVSNPNGTNKEIKEGVLQVVGGTGYDIDGSRLTGYNSDGITPTEDFANINNFLHFQTRDTVLETLLPTDGYLFADVEYTFKPNYEYLVKKQLVTLGCEPDIETDRTIINTMFAGNLQVLTEEVNSIINGGSFPDPQATQDALSAATDALRADVSVEGVAQFVVATNAALEGLRSDTEVSLASMFDAGVSPCDSKMEISDKVQFTTKDIGVTVTLNERNGISLAAGLPEEMLIEVAKKLKAHISFGEVTKFTPLADKFVAQITSIEAGTGTVMVSFDGSMLCTNNIPESLDEAPSIDIQELDYEFVLTGQTGAVSVTGDGQPRRNEGDVSRDAGNE